jgi:hypothetical protein
MPHSTWLWKHIGGFLCMFVCVIVDVATCVQYDTCNTKNRPCANTHVVLHSSAALRHMGLCFEFCRDHVKSLKSKRNLIYYTKSRIGITSFHFDFLSFVITTSISQYHGRTCHHQIISTKINKIWILSILRPIYEIENIFCSLFEDGLQIFCEIRE